MSITEDATDRWWPAPRRIDGIGVGLLVALVGWSWWASRTREDAVGPLIGLLVAAALIAVLMRWATFFHGTGAPALIVAGVLVYALTTADDLPRGLGPEGSTEAAGALLALGTGAAALLVLRARTWWPRAVLGVITIGLAVLTWRTGSLPATVIAALTVLITVGLLAQPMRERRWLVVWTAWIALLILLGTVTYAALGLADDPGHGDPTRGARWSAALEAVSDAPLYGVGRGTDAASEGGVRVPGWVQHEPLQFTAEMGLVAGLLLLAVLWWTLAWVARPGGGPGSAVAGVVIAGSFAHACLAPIWQAPAVPLTLAALAGTASMRGGDASWRLDALVARLQPDPSPAPDDAGDDDGSDTDGSRDTGPSADDADGDAEAGPTVQKDRPQRL